MRIKDIEDKLIARILPKLEKRLAPTLERIIAKFMEEEYPPESQFKKKFIREVKAAQKRIKEGKGRTFKNMDEFKKFLESL